MNEEVLRPGCFKVTDEGENCGDFDCVFRRDCLWSGEREIKNPNLGKDLPEYRKQNDRF